jgi:hypothetical protein
MRINNWILGLALALSAGTIRAEEKPEVKGDADKAALDVNYKGTILPKAKDAPEKAVAGFIINLKKFNIERKEVVLFASGEVATMLTELAKEKSKAEITGTIVEGGINVTAVEAGGKKKGKLAAQPVANGGAVPPANAGAGGQPAKTDAKNDPPKKKPSDEEF